MAIFEIKYFSKAKRIRKYSQKYLLNGTTHAQYKYPELRFTKNSNARIIRFYEQIQMSPSERRFGELSLAAG